MENKGGHGIKIHACFQEFMGTALLIFSINMAKSNFFHPIAIGVTIFSMVCLTGPTSGAHYNPAVTAACLVVEYHKRST